MVRIEMPEASTLAPMGATVHDDEPVTLYVRKLIAEWEERGGLLKELAAAGDFAAPSMISQVKLGTSAVTNFTGPKFAKAFRTTYPELVAAAYAAASGAPPRSIEQLLADAERAQNALREEIKRAPWLASPSEEPTAKTAKRARKAERDRGKVRAHNEAKSAQRAAEAEERAKSVPVPKSAPKKGVA